MLPKRENKPMPARVLVVEDEVLIRAVLADELREAGFTVIEAGHADEALTYLASGGDVDLIFTDINMPGSMNGLELARQLRRRQPRLPIILTSGNARPGGVADVGKFIAKPYSVDHALATVFETLGLSRPAGAP